MPRRFIPSLLTCALICSVVATLGADTLILASGNRVSGTVINVTQGVITFKDTTGVSRRYRSEDVVAIEFSSPAPRRPNAAILAISAGAVLNLVLAEMLDSSVGAAGQTYAATLDEPVADGDTVVLPKGTSARVAIRETAAKPGGTRAVVLQVESLTIAGRQYRVGVPAPAGSDQEGAPVKRRAFSSDFSQPSAAGPPTIRLATSVILATITAEANLPGVEWIDANSVRVQAGTPIAFSAAGPVTLQAPSGRGR